MEIMFDQVMQSAKVVSVACLFMSTYIKLIRPHRAGDFVRDAARNLNVIVRISVGFGVYFNERRTRLPERVLLFLRLRAGNDNDGLIAETVRDQGQANARVARCAFHNGPTRHQFAAVDQALYQGFGRSILHASTWNTR
jgi:hypothetical protein